MASLLCPIIGQEPGKCSLNAVKNGLPADDHCRGIQSVDDRYPSYSSQAGLSHSIVRIIRAALRYSDKWQVLRVTNYSETI